MRWHQERRAYVATRDMGLTVVDISDVANPVALGSVSVAGSLLTHLTVDGEMLYATGTSDAGFHVFNLDDSDVPAIVASLPIPQGGPVFVENEMANVSAGSKGLLFIDVSDPTHPVERGNVYVDSDITDAVVDGPLAYIADRLGGLHIVDISAYSHPPLEVTALATDSVSRLAERDGKVYAVSRDMDIQIFDMAADVPDVPVGVLQTSDKIRDIAVGDYLFYGTEDGHVMVADPSVPESPSIVADLEIVSDGSIEFLRLNGYTLMVFGSGCNFWTIDVTDPATAQVQDAYHLPDCQRGVRDIWAWDRYVAMLCNTDIYGTQHALTILDIQNPEAPVELASESIGDSTTAMVKSDQYLYVGTRHGSGIHVWDLSNPTDPAFAGIIETASPVTDLHIEGETLLVAQGLGGILAMSIEDPLKAVPITAVTLSGGAFNIDSDGVRVFATSDTNELRVVDMLICQELGDSVEATKPVHQNWSFLS